MKVQYNLCSFFHTQVLTVCSSYSFKIHKLYISSNGQVVKGSIFDIYNLQAHSVGCGFESCRVHTVPPLLHPPPPNLWLALATLG